MKKQEERKALAAKAEGCSSSGKGFRRRESHKRCSQGSEGCSGSGKACEEARGERQGAGSEGRQAAAAQEKASVKKQEESDKALATGCR